MRRIWAAARRRPGASEPRGPRARASRSQRTRPGNRQNKSFPKIRIRATLLPGRRTKTPRARGSAQRSAKRNSMTLTCNIHDAAPGGRQGPRSAAPRSPGPIPGRPSPLARRSAPIARRAAKRLKRLKTAMGGYSAKLAWIRGRRHLGAVPARARRRAASSASPSGASSAPASPSQAASTSPPSPKASPHPPPARPNRRDFCPCYPVVSH